MVVVSLLRARDELVELGTGLPEHGALGDVVVVVGFEWTRMLLFPSVDVVQKVIGTLIVLWLLGDGTFASLAGRNIDLRDDVAAATERVVARGRRTKTT